MKKEYIFLLTVLLCGFLAISFLGEDVWLSKYLAKPQGNVLLTFIGGAIFFLIQKYFDQRQAERLNDHEESQRRYHLMLEFIKSGDYYNFFTPDFKDSEGSWFQYSLKPVRNNKGEAITFNYMQMDEHLLYVDDIAFRNQHEENTLIDYISGPLKVGTAYYIKFKDGNWFIVDNDYPRRLVEIQRFGKVGPVVSKPSAIELAKPHIVHVDLSVFRSLGSFIYNKDGEINLSSGTLAEIFIDDSSNKTYIRLGHDEIGREFYITYPDGDFQEEDPFIKIQSIEGFFSSSLALLTFKNNLYTFCKNQQVSIRAVKFWNSISMNGQ